jgi:hypothetical protein
MNAALGVGGCSQRVTVYRSVGVVLPCDAPGDDALAIVFVPQSIWEL